MSLLRALVTEHELRMGGVFSTSKAFRDALEASNLGTPKKEQKILNAEFDPRSPTTEVVRTPIMVESTPARVQASRECYPATPMSPVIGKLDLDPRSPSTEIVRTPIQISDFIADPRSPTIEITRTPIVVDKETAPSTEEAGEIKKDNLSESVPDIDAIPPIPLLDLEDELANRSLSEPDLTKDDIALIRRKNASPAHPFRESTPKIKNKVMRQGHSHDDLSGKSIKVKDRSPLRVKDGQRSPLTVRTNIDFDSPRILVQRKQINKVGLSMKGPKLHKDSPKKCIPRSPSKYQSLEPMDKENMLEY